MSRKNLIRIAFAFVLLPMPAFGSTALPCPDTLHVAVDIDGFAVDESEDQDFGLLSGSHLEIDLARDESTDGSGCLFSERSATALSAERRFVEIRPLHGGGFAFELEGYTPHSHKLYSIRTKSLSAEPMGGRMEALVYDGSGPSREKLSNAVLDLDPGVSP